MQHLSEQNIHPWDEDCPINTLLKVIVSPVFLESGSPVWKYKLAFQEDRALQSY